MNNVVKIHEEEIDFELLVEFLDGNDDYDTRVDALTLALAESDISAILRSAEIFYHQLVS